MYDTHAAVPKEGERSRPAATVVNVVRRFHLRESSSAEKSVDRKIRSRPISIDTGDSFMSSLDPRFCILGEQMTRSGQCGLGIKAPHILSLERLVGEKRMLTSSSSLFAIRRSLRADCKALRLINASGQPECWFPGQRAGRNPAAIQLFFFSQPQQTTRAGIVPSALSSSAQKFLAGN
jgi:hypothetical protein